MNSAFLPEINKQEWDKAIAEQDFLYLHDIITQPLHEALYKQQNFDFLDELDSDQQMLLAYDYVQAQVRQGGFIQFIQNHYISLLLPVIEGLKKIGCNEMVQVLDDVLKVYVLNRENLDKETTSKEFAELYNEFKEFEILDERFLKEDENTVVAMVKYAIGHPQSFAVLV